MGKEKEQGKDIFDYVKEAKTKLESNLDKKVLDLALYTSKFNLNEESLIEEFIYFIGYSKSQGKIIDKEEGIEGLRTDEEIINFFNLNKEEINFLISKITLTLGYENISFLFRKGLWDQTDLLVIKINNIRLLVNLIIEESLFNIINQLDKMLEYEYLRIYK